LNIKAGKNVTMRGNENVFVDSANLKLTAREKTITLGIGKEVSTNLTYTYTYCKPKNTVTAEVRGFFILNPNM
jgi:hypothetical protein